MFELFENIAYMADAHVNNKMDKIEAYKCGIDKRACSYLWVADDCVVIHKCDEGRFNYYAGGEYVDKDCVEHMGEYVFYSAEDERVEGWINFSKEHR